MFDTSMNPCALARLRAIAGMIAMVCSTAVLAGAIAALSVGGLAFDLGLTTVLVA